MLKCILEQQALQHFQHYFVYVQFVMECEILGGEGISYYKGPQRTDTMHDNDKCFRFVSLSSGHVVVLAGERPCDHIVCGHVK